MPPRDRHRPRPRSLHGRGPALGAAGMLLGLLTLLPAAMFHGARRLVRRILGKDPGPPYSPA